MEIVHLGNGREGRERERGGGEEERRRCTLRRLLISRASIMKMARANEIRKRDRIARSVFLRVRCSYVDDRGEVANGGLRAPINGMLPRVHTYIASWDHLYITDSRWTKRNKLLFTQRELFAGAGCFHPKIRLKYKLMTCACVDKSGLNSRYGWSSPLPEQ